MSLATIRTLMTLFLVGLLAGCGGGGGGDGGAGGGLQVSRHTVSFGALQGGDLPADQIVGLQITNEKARTVVAGYPSSTTPPSWLTLGLTSSELTLHINDAKLPEGTYTTTVRVAILDAGSNVLDVEDVEVRYLVDEQFVSLTTHFDRACIQGDATPSATVEILGDGEAWTASVDAPWVILSQTHGVAPGTLGVSIDSTGLVPGTYNATVTIDDDHSDGAIVVTITLVVSSPLTLAPQILAFSGFNGQSFVPKDFYVGLVNGTASPWTATASAPWIVLSATAGTTPQALTVSVDPSIGPLASGTYSGTVTIDSTYKGIPVTATAQVTLSLTKQTLSVATGYLPMGGPAGVSAPTVSVQAHPKEAGGAFSWSVETSDAWLIPSKASGATGSDAAFTLAADRHGMSAGSYASSFTITVKVNGDTLTETVPITLNVAAHELIPATAGVSFAKLPSVSRLSSSVLIRDSYGLTDTAWSAASDSEWLSVTADGVTGDSLVLSANPDALTSDQLHYATITLTSSDTSVENAPKIRVALWKGSEDPSTRITLAGGYTTLASDPIRPYVYVHTGGGDITVVNAYTGSIVGTIASVADAIGDMAANDDGSELYVMDKVNQQIVVLDLADMDVSRRFDVAYFATETNDVVFTRIDGHPAIYLSNGFIYGTTGDFIGYTGTYFTPTRVAVSRDGSRVCQISGSDPYTMTCRASHYSSLTGRIVFDPIVVASGTSGPGVDVAVSGTGDRVYAASQGGTAFGVFTGGSLATGGDLSSAATPNNVHVSVDDSFVGSAAVHGSGTDVWFYGKDGSLRGSQDLSGNGYSILPRQLTTSGDGLRTMAITDQPALVVISSP